MRADMKCGLLFGLIALLLFACGGHDHDQFRSDVLDCEEAVAHLETCCKIQMAADACDYSFDDYGCGGGAKSVTPAFSTTESQSIQRQSCSELVNSGACEAAKAAEPNVSTTPGDESMSPDASWLVPEEAVER